MTMKTEKRKSLVRLGCVSTETEGIKGCNRDGFWARMPYPCWGIQAAP